MSAKASADGDVYALFNPNRRQMPATRITLLLQNAGVRVLLSGRFPQGESSNCDNAIYELHGRL